MCVCVCVCVWCVSLSVCLCLSYTTSNISHYIVASFYSKPVWVTYSVWTLLNYQTEWHFHLMPLLWLTYHILFSLPHIVTCWHSQHITPITFPRSSQRYCHHYQCDWHDLTTIKTRPIHITSYKFSLFCFSFVSSTDFASTNMFQFLAIIMTIINVISHILMNTKRFLIFSTWTLVTFDCVWPSSNVGSFNPKSNNRWKTNKYYINLKK